MVCCMTIVRRFYPRHPRGWRLVQCGLAVGQNGFYPRHPRGWRHQLLQKHQLQQSVSIHATLAGGDVLAKLFLVGFIFVSIHATLAGGDKGTQPWYRMKKGFYPRHPRGWRPLSGHCQSAAYRVSIHATLAGGDMPAFKPPSSSSCFYPRHPRGWRLFTDCGFLFPCTVSIHATLAGGDPAWQAYS